MSFVFDNRFPVYQKLAGYSIEVGREGSCSSLVLSCSFDKTDNPTVYAAGRSQTSCSTIG